MSTPEQLARQQIDALLGVAGWSVQDYTAYQPGAARLVAEADRRLSLIRGAEAQVSANLARAKRLRQSILQAAFAGPGSA